MIKLFIADDHSLIREGFKKLISKQTDMQVVGESDNGMDVLNAVRDADFDILILDISMPGKNGLELLNEINILRPQIKTLVFTMHMENRYAKRCLKAGADGYLSKTSSPKNLIKAIYKIMEGHKYISEQLAEQMAIDLHKGISGSDHERLSDREYNVFLQLASGKTAAEIAESINISQNTVHTYRARIFKKMNMKSVVDIVQYALRNNLLD